ncbi:MAG: hypothetical protein HUN04_12545 [Desulfobacter sp.]|nr:MAG: hypothetical protein HUN04_12545 [Desulfobacter sp.]
MTLNKGIVGMAITFMIFASNVYAGGGMTGGALEITQLANNVQLVQSQIEQAMQTQHQLNMYMAMLKNMKTLGIGGISNPQATLLDLQNVIKQAFGVSHQMGMADEYFKGMYPDYTVLMDGESYSKQHSEWTDAVVKICEASLNQADLSMANVDTDAKLLGALIEKSRTVEGQKAAIQAGNEINAQLVTKLVELKSLTAAQVKTQNTYMATQQMDKEYKEKNTRWLFRDVGEDINLDDNKAY